jgi:hypothetical protein
MSNTENSLSNEISQIIKAFDFDGDMHQNLADLGEALGDNVTDVARAYWTFWRGQAIDSELQKPDHFEREVAKTSAFIHARFADFNSLKWAAGLGIGRNGKNQSTLF